jgi:TolB-like protein
VLAFALAAALAASTTDPVVSVLYFDNLSKTADLEVMRKGFAELLIADLVAWDGVQVVERGRLEDVIKEVEFQQSKYVDQASAQKIGKLLGAKYVVTGSMQLRGKQLEVVAKVLALPEGLVVVTARESAPEDQIFDLEQRLVNQLVAGIDAKLKPDAAARRKVKVPNLETLVAYSKAIDLSDQGKLEEARAAMRAVVSRAPTFLLGRERQQELLKAFEAYQSRKKDLITSSVLELGAVIDAALKDEGQFDTLPKEAAQRFLSMRVLKGRFIARSLKQYLARHTNSSRTPLPGQEGQVLLLLRAWLANARKFQAEQALAERVHATVYNGVSSPPMLSFEVDPETARLVKDSQMEGASFADFSFGSLVRFAFEGRLDDGQGYSVAPTLAWVDAKERKALLDELDERVNRGLKRAAGGDRAAEHEVSSLLEIKAGLAFEGGDIDAAVTAYQAALDAFPTGGRAKWFEGRITQLLEGRDHEQSQRERWVKALKECDDMDLRVGVQSIDWRLRRSGLKALEEVAQELEKACPITKKNRGGIAAVYHRLAHLAAERDDCARWRTYSRRYLEADGSVSDFLGYQKNYTPWCEAGDLLTNLTWFRSRLDQNWSLEFDRHQVSVLSYDGKVLTLMAGTEGPRVPNGRPESFTLRLERKAGAAWACAGAQWQRSGGETLEGPCEVKLTREVPQGGVGFDEGTFSARFEVKEPAFVRKVEVGPGDFRVKRQ